MSSFAKRALDQYNGEEALHHGGIKGRPYWNASSSQFTYNPRFLFPIIPGAKGYLFTATDKNGKVHSFTAEKPTSFLTPIWKDLPTGMVTLKVESLDKDGKIEHLAGARTFFKCDPFPGRENLPEKACSYRECALKAYRYVFNHSMVQYLLKTGRPDPEYDLNVYPPKILSSIINSMIYYSKLEPENAKVALEVATKAADYLISISYGKGSPVEGLPPTYSFEFRNGEVSTKVRSAAERLGKIMMIYPADAGTAYLNLFNETGEQRFFDAAMIIAEYYRDNVLPCGSWYLFISGETGLPEVQNVCIPDTIMEFLTAMYKKTGDEVWKTLSDNCYKFIERNCIEGYNFEGQFEDTAFHENFSNLTHFTAVRIAKYIAKEMSADKDAAETAVGLMQFAEDQFVVWGEFARWMRTYGYNEYFESPAGLEQYDWYVPIDGSTSFIASGFMAMYELTKDELWREKAYALADKITRMQNFDTGIIPTQWITKDANKNIVEFWANCHLGTAGNMYNLSKNSD